MQVLALILLLALPASVEEAADRGARTTADPRDRQLLPPGMGAVDPCATAREIVRQPPCLASGNCSALRLWRRSFGSPRIARLDPSHTAYGPLSSGSNAWRQVPADARGRLPGGVTRWPPGRPTGPREPLDPGFICPALVDPPS